MFLWCLLVFVCVVVLSRNSCATVPVSECVCVCMCEITVYVGFLVFKCAFFSPLSVLCAADLIQ